MHRTVPNREIVEQDLASVPNIEDAAADHLGRHHPNALGDNRFLAVRDISLTLAVKAVLGLNAAKQRILRAAGARMQLSIRVIFIRDPWKSATTEL